MTDENLCERGRSRLLCLSSPSLLLHILTYRHPRPRNTCSMVPHFWTVQVVPYSLPDRSCSGMDYETPFTLILLVSMCIICNCLSLGLVYVHEDMGKSVIGLTSLREERGRGKGRGQQQGEKGRHWVVGNRGRLAVGEGIESLGLRVGQERQRGESKTERTS